MTIFSHGFDRCSTKLRGLFYFSIKKLQIFPESFDLVDKIMHIISIQWWILHHQPEEVCRFSQWLIRDHHVALLHHPFFDFRCNLVDLLVEVVISLHFLQPRRNIPETNVRAFGPIEHHFEIRPLFYFFCEVFSVSEHLIYVRFQSIAALCPPHEPEF